TVTLSAAPEDHHRVRIEVADSGIGIEGKSIEKLFIPFERLGAAEVEGSGLGLALSKAIVEGMGGRIGVRSTDGEGSIFWVQVEGAEAPAPGELLAAASGTLAPRQYTAVRRLLYVEDTLTNIRYV